MNKKEKNKMFKDAFVNDDKDFRKDVTIKVQQIGRASCRERV